MRRHRLALRSSSKANIINSKDPRAESKQQKKVVREVKVQQKLIYNGQRREARLKEKLNTQGKVMASLEHGGDIEHPNKGDHFSQG